MGFTHQNRPEYWHVEDTEPCAHESDRNGARAAVPELELRQAADEGTELFIALRGQRRLRVGVAVFQVIRIGQGWVEFRLQEGEEEIQKVDAQRVADYCTGPVSHAFMCDR